MIKRSSLLQNNLDTIDLELRGDQPWISTNCPPEHMQESNVLAAAAPNEAPSDNHIKASITALNKDLDRLAIIAQESRRLYTLRIRGRGFPRTENYLALPTIQPFLLVTNLRVLVLDLSSGFLNSSGQHGNSHHIFPAIGALLCTLGTLHVRMRSICLDVLKPRNRNDSLQLSELVINLSLNENLPGITAVTSVARSARCDLHRGACIEMFADLHEQAEALATQMAFPKVMRIVWLSLPSFETRSLEVLTGKIMILDNGMTWDEVGKDHWASLGHRAQDCRRR